MPSLSKDPHKDPHRDPPKDALALAQTRYSEFLKRNKMFLTKERTALLEFIFAQKGHFSADELLYEILTAYKELGENEKAKQAEADLAAKYPKSPLLAKARRG